MPYYYGSFYFGSDYIWFLGAMVVCMLLSAIASGRVRSTYAKFSKNRCSSGLNGFEVASRLLRANGINDISIGQVRGQLTDHYHPKKKIVNLSQSTYDSNSVAAAAVAAHEIGHVMQKHDGHLLYRIRTAIVPIVNFGSYLAMPLVLVGLLLDAYSAIAVPDIGFKVAMVGVILYGGSLLFALVTLPVELNASKRAREMLLEQGVLTEEEIKDAKKVLSAAAMTYFVSLLTSLVYFLRFLLRVLALFGRRNNR